MAWYDVVHLDRQMILTGTFGGVNTTWTMPVTDETVDTIILGPDFGANAGKILAPTDVSATTVTLAGDYSAGPVVIGRSFTMSVELTRPYRRDYNGIADVQARITIRQVTAQYHNTGYLKLRASMNNRTDRTKEIDVDPLDTRGYIKAWFNGNAENMRLFIESTKPKPCTVTALEYIVDYSPMRG